MGRKFRFALYGFAGIAAFTALASGGVYIASQARLQKDYAIQVELDAPNPALANEGRHLALTRGCTDCHGADLGGKLMIDEMPFARVAASNLTQASAARRDVNTHERLYRALRHGVDADSRSLLVMPKVFSHLSAREIEALAAYVSAIPKVERALPGKQMGPLGRTLLVAGKIDGFLTAEAIDHAAPTLRDTPAVGTVEYGRHAAVLCTGCHSKDFGGGRMPHGGPDAPPASNLTAHATGLAGWSEQDFLVAMRTGVRPDGSGIDGKVMPWRAIGRSTDAELRSIWHYLQTLPPVARNTRAGQGAN